MIVVLVAAWCTVAVLAGCPDARRPAASGPSSAASEGEAPPVDSAGRALAFTEVTAEAGLGDFRHRRGQSGEKWLPETMGAGGAFVDYNDDGWPDVVLVSGRPWSGDAPPALRLYRNRGDGPFIEVTAEVGLTGTRAYGMSVTAADYDNDGDPDLHLTALGRDRLFRNDGGTFTEVAREAGVDTPGWSTAATFFDSDRDGRLDLYVGRYVEWSKGSDLRCSLDGETATYCTPEQYAGLGGRFYHNEGDGTFADWTERAGFAGAPGKALGAVTLDYNRDGALDLLVANDGERNLLYENQADGTFSENGTASGIAFNQNGEARAGMGVGAGVVDSTGEPTVFVGNFLMEMAGVYRHLGDGLFADRAALSQVGGPSRLPLTFGLLLFDADLDADLDLFLANGHIQKAIENVQNGIHYRQPPQLFLNDGPGGTFTEWDPPPQSPLADSLVARGAAYVDYDRDGDQDVLVTENGGPAHLFRNDRRGTSSAAEGKEARYLRVALRGRASNRDGVGARVVATAGGRRIERRVRTGGSYLSQSELPLTLGLGRAKQVDSLRVEWPSGQIDRFTNVESNRQVRTVEGASALERLPASPRTADEVASAR